MVFDTTNKELILSNLLTDNYYTDEKVIELNQKFKNMDPGDFINQYPYGYNDGNKYAYLGYVDSDTDITLLAQLDFNTIPYSVKFGITNTRCRYFDETAKWFKDHENLTTQIFPCSEIYNIASTQYKSHEFTIFGMTILYDYLKHNSPNKLNGNLKPDVDYLNNLLGKYLIEYSNDKLSVFDYIDKTASLRFLKLCCKLSIDDKLPTDEAIINTSKKQMITQFNRDYAKVDHENTNNVYLDNQRASYKTLFLPYLLVLTDLDLTEILNLYRCLFNYVEVTSRLSFYDADNKVKNNFYNNYLYKLRDKLAIIIVKQAENNGYLPLNLFMNDDIIKSKINDTVNIQLALEDKDLF